MVNDRQTNEASSVFIAAPYSSHHCLRSTCSSLPPTIHGKILFHETSHWCQKGWGPLVYTIQYNPQCLLCIQFMFVKQMHEIIVYRYYPTYNKLKKLWNTFLLQIFSWYRVNFVLCGLASENLFIQFPSGVRFTCTPIIWIYSYHLREP